MRRILFVSRKFPPDVEKSSDGTFLRMRLFLDALTELADTVDILFYVDPGSDVSLAASRRTEDGFRSIWGIPSRVTLCPLGTPRRASSFWSHYLEPATRFFQPSFHTEASGVAQVAALETALENKPDAVFVHRLDSMGPLLLRGRPLPPVFLDIDDIEHVKFFREIRQPPFWLGKYLYYLQGPALCLWERRAVKFSRKAFVCSDLDRRYLERWWRLPQVATIPNAVAIPEDWGIDLSSRALLFLASYFYSPNVVGAEFLIQKIWPSVRAACPDAQLIIAGKDPERIPSFASRPAGVEFTGFVDDLASLYRRVRIACSPILSGGGTRLKILEAAAHGKAIVSTRIGAEGLDMQDGQDILLRNSGREFAAACVELLNDPRRCQALGTAARETVSRSWDRRHIVRRIKDEIRAPSVAPH